MIKIIFLILIVLYVCEKQEVKKIDVIDLLSPPSLEITLLSEITSDIKYMPLQTSENSLISNIQNIETNDSTIYLCTTNILYCFNKTGHYLYKLDNYGRGPEEYQYINDYDVSTDDKILIVLAARKILIYNITKNGFVFSKSMGFKHEPSKIDFVPGKYNILLSYHSADGSEPFRNILINLDGDTLIVRPNYNRYSKNGAAIFYLGNENINFKYNNTLHFSELFSDTVFALDNYNKFKPYLILDSHGKRPTAESRSDAISFREHFHKYIIVNNIMEVSRYLIYCFTYENLIEYAIYDKDSNKKFGKTIKSSNQIKWLKEDIAGGPNFELKYCCNESFYSLVDALTLKKLISGENFKNSIVKNPEKKKDLEKLANSIKETDNPILVMVRLKK